MQPSRNAVLRQDHVRVQYVGARLALQLGAAIVAAEDHPATLQLVTLDERLALAAEREGFVVVRPMQAPSQSSL